MKKRLILLSLLVVSTLVLGMSTAGAQLVANQDPDTTSNLSRDKARSSKKCEKEKTFTSTGQPAVVSRACTYIYSFNPQTDKSKNRGYQVFWLQSSIHPRNDFCVTNVLSEIKIPDEFRIEGKTPKFKSTDSRRKVMARLRVDAGGGRKNDEVIKQKFGLFPNSLKPNLDGNRLSVEWNGGTTQDLGFAMGIAVSYREGDLPKGKAHGTVEASLKSSC
jgi:hypothetical protein